MISVRNLANGIAGDITTGFANTTPGAGFPNPAYPGGVLSVHVRLSGGTSGSYQLEGSNDGANWGSLQTSATSLASAGANSCQSYTSTHAFLRFNPVTNVGGGTIIALLSTIA